jgi:glutamate racemase
MIIETFTTITGAVFLQPLLRETVMNSNDKKRPIGVFDSGLGGLSVLKKALELMPCENFIYYGDSLNAPYGTKSLEEVRELVKHVTDHLFERGVKGLLIACNTATSAAVRQLRENNPQFPVVGIEPAVKPAAIKHQGKRILVLATENTLKESKFKALQAQYEHMADIIKVPCSGLMEFVENGEMEGERVEAFLSDTLKSYLLPGTEAIVLGCTHYPFLKKSILKVAGDIEIFDGSLGTARELKRRIEEKGMLSESRAGGILEVINSAEDERLFFHNENGRMIPDTEPSGRLSQLTVKLLNMEI